MISMERKKYDVKVLDNNFDWKTENKKNIKMEQDIEDAINNFTDDSYFDSQCDYDSTLHSIIPIYNEDNDIDRYIVLLKDDKKRITANFLTENNDNIKEFEFTIDKIDLLIKLKKIIIDEQDYSIEDIIYDLDGEEIKIKCKEIK